MHMADALISPSVGVTMLVASATVASYSIKKIQSNLEEKKIPLMGVMGAFIFAAQMINFTIPFTGSSGHLGGGLLLAILLGPFAGFLAMISILIIQALFFADGGLLSLGCNIFNMGFFSCFVAYPLIYKIIMKKGYSPKRIFAASMISAIVGLQLGALGVVLQTFLSGKTELPFDTFLLLMQPIHLAIGIVEGLVTAAVVSFVWKHRPEIIENAATGRTLGKISITKVVAILACVAVIAGGTLSWFASKNPDGLEWSVFKTSGNEELKSSDIIHEKLSEIQSRLSFLPDYDFKASENEQTINANSAKSSVVSAGKSTAGLIGSMMTLGLATIIFFVASLLKRRKKSNT